LAPAVAGADPIDGLVQRERNLRRTPGALSYFSSNCCLPARCRAPIYGPSGSNGTFDFRDLIYVKYRPIEFM
jgi:hypothetical protein